MKKPTAYFQLFFSAVLTLFILQCNTPKSADKGKSKVPLNQSVCVGFESVPVDSTITETPEGEVGGTFIHVGMIVRKDDWTVDGYAKIDSNNYIGEGGKNLKIFNINFHYDLPDPISQFSFDFAELGGTNKIVINHNAHNFMDFPELQDIIIDGVGFDVDATQSGNNWIGSLTARGNIEHFAIGGQELWIDNLCIKEHHVLLENRRDDPNNNPTNPDGGLSQYNHFREIMDDRGVFYTEKIQDSIPLTLEYLNNFDLYVWYLSPVSDVPQAELSVIEAYVSSGGSALILTPSGNQTQLTLPGAVFNQFGVTHDGNTIHDPSDNFNDMLSHVIYDANNFVDEELNGGVEELYIPIGSTVSGNGEGWVTVVETDADATPAGQPVIIRKDYGSGKFMFSGNFSFLMGAPINVGDGNMDNDFFITNLLYFLLE